VSFLYSNSRAEGRKEGESPLYGGGSDPLQRTWLKEKKKRKNSGSLNAGGKEKEPTNTATPKSNKEPNPVEGTKKRGKQSSEPTSPQEREIRTPLIKKKVTYYGGTRTPTTWEGERWSIVGKGAFTSGGYKKGA